MNHPIKSVQYLRGIAAMMVVWHHSFEVLPGVKDTLGPSSVGAHGVDLFFVISGFIMLVTTWDKAVTPMQFMTNRIRRVVPLYWLATLVMVALSIAAPALFKSLKWDADALVKSLLFIPYQSLISPDQVWPILVPGWSLNYEMFFYALFAALLLFERNWRVPLMVGAMLSLVMAGLVWHPSSAFRIYTDPIMLEFAIGMILGRLWMMREHPRRDGGNGMLLLLGDASYSIYLTHLFTLGAIRVLWVRLVPEATVASSAMLVVVSLTASAIVGCVCYWWIESPLTKAMKYRPAPASRPSAALSQGD
jgi:exopolysaccharide production protein ExoZ